jgi:CheY-like chemotaxis protein
VHTILLLEDDEDDALLFVRAVAGVSKLCVDTVQVTHKKNGAEGLNVLMTSKNPVDLPDTIVVDLNMPIMDGMAFLRWLRSEPGLSALHAVVLTTSTELTIHAAAIDAGANRVFVKPNSFREVITIVSEIMPTVM